MNRLLLYGLLAYVIYVVIWYYTLKYAFGAGTSSGPKPIPPGPCTGPNCPPPPPCTGPNCPPVPCTGPNCPPVPCTGPNCPPVPCTGPNCPPVPCTGPNCPPVPCTGPNCPPVPCTGPNCPPPPPVPCTGPNCPPVPCTGPNCPPVDNTPKPPASGRWYDCGEGVVQDDKMISGFCGTFSWLSNFYEPAKVTRKGLSFNSVEAAYHASKYDDQPDIAKQFVGLSAPDAYKLSKTTGPYDYKTFDAAKLDIMRDLIKQKYGSEPLLSKLKATGTKTLQEWNWWGNKYWGMSPDGENWLGKIIMEIRSTL